MSMDKETFLKAYRIMRTIRDFEYRVSDEFGKGNIPGFLHLYAGQEAVAAGMCINLTDEDYIVSTHRGHGHCIAKGGDVGEMMKEIMAREGGSCAAKGGSMHIAAVEKGMLGANAIVGGGPPLIVGAALSAKTLGTDRIGVSFTGDGGSNQGTTFEAMNLAVVLKLPAIFLFENNGYGEGTGASYAVGSKDIASRAKGFGMPALKMDGTDLFDTYATCRKAAEHCRAGKGPYILEMNTYRYRGHSMSDPAKYRTREEVQKMREERDPIDHVRDLLLQGGEVSEDDLKAVDKEIKATVNESAKFAQESPEPDEAELWTDIYA